MKPTPEMCRLADELERAGVVSAEHFLRVAHLRREQNARKAHDALARMKAPRLRRVA